MKTQQVRSLMLECTNTCKDHVCCIVTWPPCHNGKQLLTFLCPVALQSVCYSCVSDTVSNNMFRDEKMWPLTSGNTWLRLKLSFKQRWLLAQHILETCFIIGVNLLTVTGDTRDLCVSLNNIDSDFRLFCFVPVPVPVTSDFPTDELERSTNCGDEKNSASVYL